MIKHFLPPAEFRGTKSPAIAACILWVTMEYFTKQKGKLYHFTADLRDFEGVQLQHALTVFLRAWFRPCTQSGNGEAMAAVVSDVNWFLARLDTPIIEQPRVPVTRRLFWCFGGVLSLESATVTAHLAALFVKLAHAVPNETLPEWAKFVARLEFTARSSFTNGPVIPSTTRLPRKLSEKPESETPKLSEKPEPETMESKMTKRLKQNWAYPLIGAGLSASMRDNLRHFPREWWFHVVVHALLLFVAVKCMMARIL
jgi:hypothetical protein